MKKLFVVFVLLLLPALAHAFTFAQLALGGGYEAVLLVSNVRSTTWTGTFRLKAGNNAVWPKRWSLNGDPFASSTGFTLTLPGNGTSKVTLAGEGDVQAGYLEYFGTGSSIASDVVVSYFYVYRSGGALQDSTGSAKLNSHRGFDFPVERSGTVDTGFAWAPDLATNGFPITVSLHDRNGVLFQQKTVSFLGHKAQFFSEFFDGVPSNFIGRMRVDAAEFLFLEVLRLEQNATGFQLTSTPPDPF